MLWYHQQIDTVASLHCSNSSTPFYYGEVLYLSGQASTTVTRPTHSTGSLHMLPGYTVEALFTLFEFQLSCSSGGKESTCKVGDLGSIPGLGRSPGEGKGYPLQYSNLENPMHFIVHGVTKNQTRPSDFHFSLSPLYVFPVEGFFYIIVDFSNPYSRTTHFFIYGQMLFSTGLPQIQPVRTSGPPSTWISFLIFSDLNNLYEMLMPHTLMAFMLDYDISY